MKTSPRLTPLINFLLYQVAWFGCVMGAAAGQPLVGVGLSALIIGLHLALSSAPMTELRIIVLTGIIGGLWETLIVQQDWVRYQGSTWAGFPPLWIVALWPGFATTFNSSLRWLQPRTGLASLLGLVGGPLAWVAGERLGALQLPNYGLDLMAIGLGWSVLMPVLLLLTQRLSDQSSADCTVENPDV